MLKVDKLCALRFIRVIKAYDSNSSHYEREVSSFFTSNYEVLNDLYSPELTAACLAKFTISSVGFEHSPGCEKFESQNFRKMKLLLSYFILVTYLPR